MQHSHISSFFSGVKHLWEPIRSQGGNARIRGTLCAGVAVSFTLGCGDPLKFPQELEETRVLGVQIETEKGTSFPKDGESATVRLLMAGPDGPTEVQAAYRACASLESAWGVPQCGDLEVAEGVTEPSLEPAFTFEGKKALLQQSRFSILGVVCDDSEPTMDGPPEDWACADDSPALRFSFETETDQETNEVPVLERTRVFYEGDEAALSSSLEAATCDGAVAIPAGETVSVRLELDERARSADEEEVLQLSHYSTKGRFERQYTILDPTEDLSVTIDFESPDTKGAAKSYLVVRDGRGGTAWLSWDVCVSEKSTEQEGK